MGWVIASQGMVGLGCGDWGRGLMVGNVREGEVESDGGEAGGVHGLGVGVGGDGRVRGGHGKGGGLRREKNA